MGKFIMFYLGVSVSLAISYIRRVAKAENYVNTFPMGDIDEFISVDYSFNPSMYVFFPSIILVKLYMCIVRVINSLL